ncbi:hypothetical protein JKP75_11595 [Blastococcus sp. TML/M2B]|uniref:hypothetical protein n=1 Tax=unclassified Blastococcus TaxID=2619396 RepID=UPI00190DE018|nr:MULTISPECIES: hypothetical protein [unclassified Blastococcus]MBN1093138.1 hypothetical protein [Blastococcus sp. TML/M2B]MBN1096742.1 hypothetical protein [Blastococcus sp. TML/C7B]
MRLPVAALAAALTIGGMLSTAAPAAAGGPLAPGGTQTVVVAVPASWAAEATQIAVSIRGLEQAENGCLEVEAEAGDDCSSDVGELAGKLSTTAAWGRAAGATCEPGAAPVPVDLFGAATARLADPGGVQCVLLAMTFLDGDSDNVAQSDTLTFDLVLVAEGPPDSPGTTAGGTAGGTGTDVPASGGGQVPGEQGVAPAEGGGQAGAAPEVAASGGAAPPVVGGRAVGGGAVAGGAAPGGPGALVGGGAPAGPELDRVDAQITVGGAGAGVETQAAATSFAALVLAWGAALLALVGLGWMLFLVLRRRRRRAASGQGIDEPVEEVLA